MNELERIDERNHRLVGLGPLPNGVEAEGRIRAAVGDRYLIEFSQPVRVSGSATSREAEWDTWTWVTWSQIERYDASRQKWTRSGLDALGELR